MGKIFAQAGRQAGRQLLFVFALGWVGCSAPGADDAASSTSEALTGVIQAPGTGSPLTKVHDLSTAAGQVALTGGLVPGAMTFFVGFNGTAPQVGLTRRIEGGAASVPVALTSSLWTPPSSLNKVGGGPPDTFNSYHKHPSVVWSGVGGQFVAAVAVNGTTDNDDLGIVINSTPDGGLHWGLAPFTITQGEHIRAVQLFVDPFPQDPKPAGRGDGTHEIYLYYTADPQVVPGTGRHVYLHQYYVDAAGTLHDDGPYAPQPPPQFQDSRADTATFVVGRSMPPQNQKFMAVNWALRNPLDYLPCPRAGTSSQVWAQEFIAPINGSNPWGNITNIYTDATWPDCVAGNTPSPRAQVNFPKPAVVYDAVTWGVHTAFSVSSPLGLRVHTFELTNILFGSSGPPAPMPAWNGPDPKTPGGGTRTDPTDQVLPQLAINSANRIAVAYYDDRDNGTPSARNFGAVYAQAGTTTSLFSLPVGVDQNVVTFDAEDNSSLGAPSHTFFGLSPSAPFPQFMGTSVASASSALWHYEFQP